MTFTDRDKQVMLAACWGVIDALKTQRHLGDAARLRGLASRTLKGDTYETAFEWAREEDAYYNAAALRVGCNNCEGPAHEGPCT